MKKMTGTCLKILPRKTMVKMLRERLRRICGKSRVRNKMTSLMKSQPFLPREPVKLYPSPSRQTSIS
jgi:hypothetical protein